MDSDSKTVDSNYVFTRDCTIKADWETKGDPTPSPDPTPTPTPTPTPDPSDKDDDKKGKDDENSSSQSEVFNRDEVLAYSSLNGSIQGDVKIGKQKQGPLAESLFIRAIPAGWKAAFSMSMSVNGKNDYSLKNIYIVMQVPVQYQKMGRQFAFLAMDENGKVFVLNDLDPNADVVKVYPNIKGYAYYLIYKD